MSKRGKRKAFGVSKKVACDLHHCLKNKKLPSKLSPATSGIKHLQVNNSSIIK
jgi:hypothetical protein